MGNRKDKAINLRALADYDELRPYLSPSQNVKTLDPDKTFAEQVTQENTMYKIIHPFDLGGETVTIPVGCTLVFAGGSLSNGTLVGTDTGIVAPKMAIFIGITISGTWNVYEIISAWFSDAASNNGLKNVFALQSANVHNRIVIENGSYVVSATQENDKILECLSDLDLIIDGNIMLSPNSYEMVIIISIFDESHVNISGSGTVTGDKETHTGETGQWGHGIYVSGSFVTIKDITVKDCWGDCIAIGRSKSQISIEVKNVVVDNCWLDNGRRQGLSVTHGGNIVIRNCRISNVGGTNPQAGIDIEPNENCYADNIVVENCRVEDCLLGIIIYGRGKYTKSCITITNCYIKCVRRAFAVNGISTAIKITNNEVHTRFHVVDANTVDGSQDNIILFENNMIVQQPEEGDDMSQDARGCAIYAMKGDYCFRHNAITCVLPVFHFASGNKFIEDNDITCGDLFYPREYDNVRIIGNRINGNVTLPGGRTIFENNAVRGLLKSTAQYETTDEHGETVINIIIDTNSIVKGNFITNVKEGNAVVSFRRRVVVDGNIFINVALNMSEGIVTNNLFTYNANFVLTGILLNLAYSDFVNNTVNYGGTNEQDANIYMVRSGNSIVGNIFVAASRIQYVLYPVAGCFISGNKFTLPEGHATNRLINTTDCTIIQTVRTTGTSEERPTLPSDDRYYIGSQYLDTTLGKIIVWNGDYWIDTIGTRVTWERRYILTNISASNSQQPDANSPFTTVLTADEGYSLPSTITVKMNNVTLTVEIDYTYDQTTGEVVILGTGGTGGVTGDILIGATGVEISEP